MTVEVASVVCNGPGLIFPGPQALTIIDNRDNRMSPCEGYQQALDQTTADVLVMLHDDVTVYDENWLTRLTDLFLNPKCVAGGFGGGTSLGRADLYRKGYNIWNMARGGYASNQTDAEVHGARFTGYRQVAVLDAFCMAFRPDWLRQRGWPVTHLTHHCLDLWLACEAARDDKHIWMAGVSCTHHGGGSSTSPLYRDAKWLQGDDMPSDHTLPHAWLARTYPDVLPIEVT